MNHKAAPIHIIGPGTMALMEVVGPGPLGLPERRELVDKARRAVAEKSDCLDAVMVRND